MKNKDINIAGYDVKPGSSVNLKLPSADLYIQTNVTIPIHVFHGIEAGPRFFITSTIHGDEVNSIEILRRLHLSDELKRIRGTLITIPVINIHGFILQSRYLPDRRDLNRSFPGSKAGSLAARLANILTEEVISKCQYGIDLHTGAIGHINMPQLRVNPSTAGTKEMARAFDVPVILDAKLRDGSLRGAANDLGIPMLVYEGGEALRYNEVCIRAGLRGILNVLNYLGMIKLTRKKPSKSKPVFTETSRWIRASTSGLMQPLKDVAEHVHKNELIALIHDPFLINPSIDILAPFEGIIIGVTTCPLVNEGDAMYHIASIRKSKKITAYIDEIRTEITNDI